MGQESGGPGNQKEISVSERQEKSIKNKMCHIHHDITCNQGKATKERSGNWK